MLFASLAVLLSVWCVPCCSYLWSVLLTNPVPMVNDDETLHDHPIRHHHADKELYHHDKNMIPCSPEEPCPSGMFCDRHYGVCDTFRQEDEFCRRDYHCFHPLQCIHGRCRKPIKKGEIGARCSHDFDCGAHACCARLHGALVCKTRPILGHRCHVPSGGLEYSLNEQCPCDQGLVCQHITTKKTLDIAPEGHWKHKDHLRCIKS